jgi:hypothetical protein
MSLSSIYRLLLFYGAILCGLALGLVVVPVQGQTQAAFLEKIEKAIQKNDVTSLAPLLNGSVELSVNNRESVYNREQAKEVVREFFMNYPVRTFRLLHNGANGGNAYAVGEYQSTRGSFHTNILIRKVGEQFVVDQLRFEPN